MDLKQPARHALAAMQIVMLAALVWAALCLGVVIGLYIVWLAIQASGSN